MAETFALLAALFFSASHILIRRGLVTSNALTGSFISLSLTALIFWVFLLLLVPLSRLITPAVWYFFVGGIFAPGLGRTFSYLGIERVGVARAVPITNSSPMFASILAVLVVGENWTAQNFLGTSAVVLAVVILSGSRPGDNGWRRVDLVYPFLSALSFGVAANLRKLGLLVANEPFVAAAVTSATGLLLGLAVLRSQGGFRALKLSRRGLVWFFLAGLANTSALLAMFHALSFGPVVVVEPLAATNPVLTILLSAIFLRDLEAVNIRVAAGTVLAVAGSLMIVTA